MKTSLVFGAPTIRRTLPSARPALRLILLVLLLCIILEGIPRLTVEYLRQRGLDAYGPKPPVTHAEGHRATVGQPEHYQYRVLLFGNSALAGFWLADADTIPSQLQALLPDVRVENYGDDNANISRQVLILQDVELHPGDVVIFMDGVQDADLALGKPAACGIPISLSKLVCDQFIAPQVDADLQADDHRAVRLALDQARDYAGRAGVKFIHIWQPRRYRAAYQGEDLRATQALTGIDPGALNWSDMFADNITGKFLDVVHTTPVANRLIAVRIAGLVEYF